MSRLSFIMAVAVAVVVVSLTTNAANTTMRANALVVVPQTTTTRRRIGPPPASSGIGPSSSSSVIRTSSRNRILLHELNLSSRAAAPANNEKNFAQVVAGDETRDLFHDDEEEEKEEAEAADTRRTITNNVVVQDDHHHQFTPFQLGVRSIVLLTTIFYMIHPQPLDDMISFIYSIIYNWDVAHGSLFEAKVAVMGFFIPIVMYSSLHLLLGPEKTKASRFDGRLPTRPFEWLEIEHWNVVFNPISSYLGSIWIYHQFIHSHADLPQMAPTFGVFAIEVLFGVWLYDLLFFPIHYFMHRSPTKWKGIRKIHGYHHRVTSHSLNALETVQHSYIDGFLQVTINVLVQQLSPFGPTKHMLSRLFHNIIVTYLLTEAHSGYYDLPWMSHNIFPEILGGSPRHEQHHHDGRIYYQQYFKYLDDFFGFTKEEDEQQKQQEQEVLPTTKRKQLEDATTVGTTAGAVVDVTIVQTK